jgi:hypothetical protein
MNHNKKTVDAYVRHVVNVNQGVQTFFTLGGNTSPINYAIDIESFLQTIKSGGQYKYEINKEAPLTQEDIMLGMVFRRVQKNGVKMAPDAAHMIYHIRSYGKDSIYIGAGSVSVSYQQLTEDYEYAIDMRAWSNDLNPCLEWYPAKKTSPHYEFSPSYESLTSVMMDEPKFDEDPDDDL